MKLTSFLSALAWLFVLIEAKNDWNQPCLSGTCSFDIARSSTSMGATLTINGSSSSISDITTAAGWNILNCSTSTNTQTFQLVCTDESKGCNHLFEDGAENTIVRLPEDCGAGPFARVVEHSIPSNQTLPAGSKVRRSDGTALQIQQLRIDGNFSEAAPNGQFVNFSLIASTDPNAIEPSSTSTSFRGGSNGSAPITLEQLFTLVNNSASCTGNADVMVLSVETLINLNFAYSFEASGTLAPSSVNTLVVNTNIEGTVEAFFDYTTELVGTVDTGDVSLNGGIELPGLSIENIIEIDTDFALIGRMSGTFGVDMSSSSTIRYSLSGFATSVGSSMSASAGFTPLSIPLDFEIDPTGPAQSTFQGNIMPELSYDISAFDKNFFFIIDLESGVQVDVTNSIEGARASSELVACVTASAPIAFTVSGAGDFFDIFGFTLEQTILDTTLNLLDSCPSEGQELLSGDEVTVTRRSEEIRPSFRQSRTRTATNPSPREAQSVGGNVELFARALECPPENTVVAIFAPIVLETVISDF